MTLTDNSYFRRLSQTSPSLEDWVSDHGNHGALSPVRMRGAALQNALPSIAGGNSLTEHVDQLSGSDAGVRWPRAGLELVKQRPALVLACAELLNSAQRLTGVGKRLAHPGIDVEQVFAPPGRTETDVLALAIVEHVGGFVHDDIVEAVAAIEVAHRDVAGRTFAEADDIRAAQVRVDRLRSSVGTGSRGARRCQGRAPCRAPPRCWPALGRRSLDRLSRNQADIAALYQRLDFLGVHLETLADGRVNEMHVGLKGTMSAQFLKDLAQKTRRGQMGRVKAGRIPGGHSYTATATT